MISHLTSGTQKIERWPPLDYLHRHITFNSNKMGFCSSIYVYYDIFGYRSCMMYDNHLATINQVYTSTRHANLTEL